ncbi:MAG: hypothetical protein GC150_08490 [Rhizobiales bacterium]|nr:hypothetical protein [Hyphomicrobiales bacterium]
MQDLLLFAYAGLTGFTLAGLTVTLFEIVSGRSLVFALRPDVEAFVMPVSFLVRLLGGPLLLARMTLREDVGPGQRMALGCGAIVWSLCTGITVLA